MKYAEVTHRLSDLGGEKWTLHTLAQKRQLAGHDVINMTIGEPDMPTPTALVDVAVDAMRNGRTGYSSGQGEPALLDALANRYTKSSGRPITTDNILCWPGTQTALYGVMRGVAEAGDEVIVGDPMYATYEGVIAATGARMVAVPLKAEHQFRMQANDIRPLITERTTAIFINSPHNPTGAILTETDIAAIGELAIEHDLWIIADEVYEDMVFDEASFVSPLQRAELASRVVVTSSISKSHAAAGFRSGWCVGPAEFCQRVLPLAETMLFGNQPFIADMTAAAIADYPAIAADMRKRFAQRRDVLMNLLNEVEGLKVNRPQAGMFLLVDIAATGMTGDAYARKLLEETNVAVMPGTSFGNSLKTWIRLALTIDDKKTHEAGRRIAEHLKKVMSQEVNR